MFDTDTNTLTAHPRCGRSQHHRLRTAVVNDIHSARNATAVSKVLYPRGTNEVIRIVKRASLDKRPVAVAGGRHAMGGQQFARGALLVDMSEMNRILRFDTKSGRVEVEAGIQWPALMLGCHVLQHRSVSQWGITQKQTGADRLSIGGAIAANIHGRGLRMQPFIQDIVDLTLVNAHGELVRCSRSENPDLFRLVVGGYGLFGIVVKATLQLSRRIKLERVVETASVDALMSAFDARRQSGFLYGDFQFAIDPASDGFLTQGILSCYRPVENQRPIPENQVRLSRSDWARLLRLAHTEKTAAFEHFRDFYLRSSGQLYWSDTHQLSLYLDDYHAALDRAMCAPARATETITELYVPRDRLVACLEAVKSDFRSNDVDLIYGTVRLIEKDDESFLSWAKDSYACVIFNLHVEHTPQSIEQNRDTFRRLIDIAIANGGSYFLTYHRYASREQILSCYPEFPEFLRRKLEYDPEERFQSEWYRHYRTMFAERQAGNNLV